MSLLTKLFQFVLLTSSKYDIDETHGISHSMKVLQFANNIYEAERFKHPILQNQERIIYVSAILHDMCDKKYVNEEEGLSCINNFLRDKLTTEEIYATKKIITTMSYSKVKKNGFPDLQEYQMAYHVVREADLLSAYDFDRCMLYNIRCQIKKNGDDSLDQVKIMDAYNDAQDLFNKRVLTHNKDKLFITDYSKERYLELHIDAMRRMNAWKRIMKNPTV
jgi:HD superfamily phosphodiesterase